MIATEINIYIFIVTCLRSRACSLQPEHYIRPTVQWSSLMNGNASIAFNKRKFILFLPRTHKRELTTVNEKKNVFPIICAVSVFRRFCRIFCFCFFFGNWQTYRIRPFLFEFVIGYFFGRLGWSAECEEVCWSMRSDVGMWRVMLEYEEGCWSMSRVIGVREELVEYKNGCWDTSTVVEVRGRFFGMWTWWSSYVDIYRSMRMIVEERV